MTRPTVAALIDALAAALEWPRDDVAQYARSLRDAGALPKSAGRAHPAVSARHAAALMVAVAAARNAFNAAIALESTARLVPTLAHPRWAGPTLLDAVENILAGKTPGSAVVSLRVRHDTDWVTIEYYTARALAADNDPPPREINYTPADRDTPIRATGLIVSREIEAGALHSITEWAKNVKITK